MIHFGIKIVNCQSLTKSKPVSRAKTDGLFFLELTTGSNGNQCGDSFRLV